MEFGVFIHISASENSMYVYCIQLFFMQGWRPTHNSSHGERQRQKLQSETAR